MRRRRRAPSAPAVRTADTGALGGHDGAVAVVEVERVAGAGRRRRRPRRGRAWPWSASCRGRRGAGATPEPSVHRATSTPVEVGSRSPHRCSAEPGRVHLGLEAERPGPGGRRTGGAVRVLRDLGWRSGAAPPGGRRTPARPRRRAPAGSGSQPSGTASTSRDQRGDGAARRRPQRDGRTGAGPAPTSAPAARTGARRRRAGRPVPRRARAGGAHRPARPPGDPRRAAPSPGRLGRWPAIGLDRAGQSISRARHGARSA